MSKEPDESTRIFAIVNNEESDEAQSQARSAYFVVLVGNHSGEMYSLQATQVIGRSQECNIRIADDGVSRRHARVDLLPTGGIEVVDLDSSNGIYVNGDRVSRAVLNDGDKIRLGPTALLKFCYQDVDEEAFQRKLIERASRDALTDCYNKTIFLDRLKSELAFARRHQTWIGVLLIDVDMFKQINDTNGHLAGDYALKTFADLVRTKIRTEDLFARYGGDEFALLVRGIAPANMMVLGERLRAAVQSQRFFFDGKLFPVTISVGGAAYPSLKVADGISLVKAADEALYEAKRQGRNRVVITHGDPPSAPPA